MMWQHSHDLGCTDTDKDTGTSTIRRHKQFLKNYNMIWQIGHSNKIGMTQIRYEYDTQMKCPCILGHD